jgi:octaprenyl-diphosphate synthase
MTKNLKEISTCIEKELEKFEEMFKSFFECDEDILNQVLSYLYSQKGKHIRPIISFLVAKTYGQVNEKTLRSAIILELLHTASLLHDDVIDDSFKRRNKKTVNIVWDNKTAILVGDYLYGKCLSLIKTQEDFNLMPVYAKIGVDLPEGELREKYFSENLNTNINNYLKVIYQKTASLLACSAKVGALTCNNKEISTEKIEDLGESLGMAFQIKDDILDFSLTDESGKGIGNDIKEKKITLPTIYYLEEKNNDEQRQILDFISKDNKEETEIKSLIVSVNNSQAIQKAENILKEYSNKAQTIIETMPKNIYSEALNDLVQYLIDRKK